MTLLELISDISDSTDVVVLDSTGKEVSRYDGKDSIDEEYNDFQVGSIDCENGTIIIGIITE